LAALVDELMRTLVAKDVMDRGELQGIENSVSERTGAEPRHW
jgi:hypothetical protein